jgi:hypothetical protein
MDFRTIGIGAIAALALSGLVGCAAQKTGHSAGKPLAVEVFQKGSAKVVAAGAQRSVEDLAIEGKVERIFPSPVRGHVDIAVMDGDGRVIAKGSVGYLPHNIQRRGRHRASFHARLKVPEDRDIARIRIQYHGKAHGAGGISDCGDNVAVTNG